MIVMRAMGLFAIIPASVLLTISYFVLAANKRQEEGNLKAFGYVTAILLWIAASLVLLAGSYTVITGKHPMQIMMKHIVITGKHPMQIMMKHMMKQCPMMKDPMDPMCQMPEMPPQK